MFDTTERSRFGGKPIRLFRFTRQHLVWRFCTADRDLTIDGQVWLSAQIDRSEIKQTPEKAKDKIMVNFDYLLDVAAATYPVTQSLGDNWRPYVPTDDVGVECFAMHYGEAAAPVLEWIGVVTGVKFGDVALELTCEPNGSHQLARDQGAKWSKSCWKTVYSTGIRGCNLPGAPTTLQATITKLEQLAGDVAPAAHVLAPELTAYIAGLAGKTASWVYEVPTERIGTVTAIDGSDVTLDDVTGIAVGTVLDWIDGSSAAQSGTVTAIDGDVATLDDVTRLNVAIVCNWNEDVATLATATITDAYFAYDYVTSTSSGSQTGFSWNSIGELSDMSGSGWSVTYTKRAALVLSDTTGLAVDSVIEVQMTGGATVATLTAVNGLQLTAAEFATTQFALGGGYLTYIAANGLLIRRGIADHAQGSNTLTLTAGGPNPPVDAEVTVLPSCPRTWAACAARGNTINFGGAFFKPVKTPEGSSMSWDN